MIKCYKFGSLINASPMCIKYDIFSSNLLPLVIFNLKFYKLVSNFKAFLNYIKFSSLSPN